MSEDPEKCKFHVKISFELIPEVSLLTGGAPDLIWGSRDWWPLWGQIGQVLGFYDYNIMSHCAGVTSPHLQSAHMVQQSDNIT